MLEIRICDDDLQQAQQFYNRLQNGAYTRQPLQLHLFHTCRELLDSAVSLDLLFLDIEMPEMSGIDLLRKHGSHPSSASLSWSLYQHISGRYPLSGSQRKLL